MTTVLIPCAGFGKRVGPLYAKELLILHGEQAPLIQWSLDLIKSSKMNPLAITRKNKTTFLGYLERVRKIMPLQIYLIDSSSEWPDTLLQSQSHWSQKNIVLLPDTRFEPQDILSKIQNALDESDLAFATFDAKDLSTWGVLKYSDHFYWVAEKPIGFSSESTKPWGIFGFRKEFGVDLLTNMLESNRDHKYKKLNTMRVSQISLNSFEDVARDSSKLSEYDFLQASL